MGNPEPGRRGRHRRWRAVMMAGLLTGLAAAPAAALPPSSPNVGATETERLVQAPKRPASPKATPRRPTPKRPAAKKAPAKPARELRVTSDVPGAMVFLDRKYLGTTPLASADVVAGPHELNVQVEGRPPVVKTIEIAATGPTAVAITVPSATAALDAQVAVVHEHARGGCDGTLRATPDGLRYDSTHKDAFTAAFPDLETFSVDYAARKLRVKVRKGKSYTFTTREATADPLFVFHRDVEAGRPRP
jgi:hypothetical protein